MSTGSLSPARAGILSIFLCFAWQAFVVHGGRDGNWTSLFSTGSRYPVPPLLFPHTYVIPNSDGYDGQFYRYMAHDPLLSRGFTAYIDDARYRYARILILGIAYVLALGQDPAIDWTY